MTTKLGLYKAAALAIGEETLSSLSDATAVRRALDDAWDNATGGDIRRYWLRQDFWNHALRTVSLTYSPSVTPSFGLAYAFDQPSDMVRLYAVGSEPRFCQSIEYNYQGGYLFADFDAIYIQYVSDDNAFGYDYSLWPPDFSRWCGVHLASLVCERVTQNKARAKELREAADPEAEHPTLLLKAKSKDAMETGTRVLASGSWTNARLGRSSYRYQRG